MSIFGNPWMPHENRVVLGCGDEVGMVFDGLAVDWAGMRFERGFAVDVFDDAFGDFIGARRGLVLRKMLL